LAGADPGPAGLPDPADRTLDDTFADHGGDQIGHLFIEQQMATRPAHQLFQELGVPVHVERPDRPGAPRVSTLIKLNVDTAQYWDTPGGRVASAISFAKSKITGQRYEGGDNPSKCVVGRVGLASRFQHG